MVVADVDVALRSMVVITDAAEVVVSLFDKGTGTGALGVKVEFSRVRIVLAGKATSGLNECGAAMCAMEVVEAADDIGGLLSFARPRTAVVVPTTGPSVRPRLTNALFQRRLQPGSFCADVLFARVESRVDSNKLFTDGVFDGGPVKRDGLDEIDRGRCRVADGPEPRVELSALSSMLDPSPTSEGMPATAGSVLESSLWLPLALSRSGSEAEEVEISLLNRLVHGVEPLAEGFEGSDSGLPLKSAPEVSSFSAAMAAAASRMVRTGSAS